MKLSGELLSGEKGFGIDWETLDWITEEIKETLNLGCQIGIVIGGGNFIRGIDSATHGIERKRADYMGMIATYLNAIAIEDFLEKKGVESKIYGSLGLRNALDTYDSKEVLSFLKEGRVTIFAGGTGNPYFSTDTAAVLKASELKANAVFKATKVDGVFDKDPAIHKDAKFLNQISYLDAIKMRLRVIDLTALSLAMELCIPIVVFNMKVRGNLKKVAMGEPIGTIIRDWEAV